MFIVAFYQDLIDKPKDENRTWSVRNFLHFPLFSKRIVLDDEIESIFFRVFQCTITKFSLKSASHWVKTKITISSTIVITASSIVENTSKILTSSVETLGFHIFTRTRLSD